MDTTKLRNVEAVKKLLHGEHRTQTRTSVSTHITIGSKLSSERKAKKIGETWFEYTPAGNIERVVTKIGNDTYYQRSELIYNTEKSGLTKDKYKFVNCPKETCTCVSPTRLDEKFRVLVGKCLECNIAYETKLKIEGKFDEYATDMLLKNANSYFKYTDAQLEEFKSQLRGGVEYVNSDGRTDKWESSTGDVDSIIERVEDEYTNIKNNTLNAIKGDI